LIGSANISFDSTAFATAKTITLGSAGTMNIPTNTTITGPTTGSGATLTQLVTVSGANQYGIFQTGSGGSGVTLNGLALVNGNSSQGGAIFAQSALNVINTSFTGNTASSGGGGYGGAINSNGALTITNSTFTGNTSTGTLNFGGAIYANSTLTIGTSTFTGNSASGGLGGVICVTQPITTTVTDSTFTGNSAAVGGAINTNGPLAVSNSTFSGNSATGGDGGAITASSTLTVTGSTFTLNSVSEGSGGAIAGSATLTVADSTFAGNSAHDSAGAIFTGGMSTVFSNSVFDNNPSSHSAGINAHNGGATADHNLFYGGDTCTGCTTNTNAVTGNAMLSALGSYGGATQTMLPLPGSAAICAGVAVSINSAPITADQRGVSIPTTYNGTQCYDIGAVQTNYAMSSTLSVPSVVTLGSALSPAPTVTITESGTPLTAGTATVTITDADNDLSSSGTNTATNSTGTVNPGQVTFSNLQFTAAEASDSLTATLPLNPALPPPLNLTATSGTFQVGQIATVLSFTPSPTSQTYGTAIAVGSLDATATANSATVPGAFAYTTTIAGVANQPVVAGTTILPAGVYTITATFTPTNAAEYSSTSTTATYTVNKAALTLTFVPSPASQTYGTAIAAGSLDATATANSATVAGTFAYTTTIGGVANQPVVAGVTILPAGVYTVTATFTPTSTASYGSASTTATYTVNKAALTLTFVPSPASQTYGTAIAAGSLDATATANSATAAGTFAYTTTIGGVPNQPVVAGTTILPAGVYTITATFTPTSTASYSSASTTATYTVNKATPTITWHPASIELGYSLGSAQLDATASVPGGFVYTPLSGTPVIATTQSLSVVFTPADTTDYNTASLTEPLTVTPGPLVSVSPSTLPFGTVYLGSLNPKTVTVKNTGNAAMTISDPLLSVAQGGNSSEFVVLNLCPKSLAAGNSCTIIVTFVAGPFFNPQTATLSVVDNVPGSPQTVTLSAQVIDPLAQPSVNNWNFGTQKEGTSSTPKAVTLNNPGLTALTINSITISGGNASDFSETNNCPASLAPKSSCTINVTFKPTAKGLRSSSVVITDNAFNSPQRISLSGTGN
jgi:predicted outer membrane repeat protein